MIWHCVLRRTGLQSRQVANFMGLDGSGDPSYSELVLSNAAWLTDRSPTDENSPQHRSVLSVLQSRRRGTLSRRQNLNGVEAM